MTLHPFDEAIAVGAPTRDGAWGVTVSDSFNTPNGPNGGYVAALVLNAILTAVGDPARPPRSLTLQYLRSPAPGPSEVEVDIVQTGRTATFTRAALVQGGRTVITAVCVLAIDVEPAADSYSEPMPQPRRPPDDLRRFDGQIPDAPQIWSRFATRTAFGDRIFSGSGEALTGGWLTFADPRPLDYCALAQFADAWMPAPYVRLSKPAAAPTLDLTIHFRSPPPPTPDPVLVRFHSTNASHGFFEEDGSIWAQDGTLLVQSRQLALLR